MIEVYQKNIQTFCYSHVQALNEYCRPMFQKTDVSFFYFNRFYDDGTSYFLTTNPEWVPYAFEKCYPLIAPLESDCQMNKFVQVLSENQRYKRVYQDYEDILSIENGINLVYRKPGYIDLFCFAFQQGSRKTYNFIMNQLFELERFSSSFCISQLSPVLKKAYSHRILLPEVLRPNFKGLSSSSDSDLTSREQQCAFYIRQGYTDKMIAEALSLSPRTVNDYVYNLRMKMNCVNKAMLIQKLNQSEFI